MARAIERLREVRRSPADGTVLIVGTADPLNLAGIITSGDRIRAATRNRVAYIDGVPWLSSKARSRARLSTRRHERGHSGVGPTPCSTRRD